MDLCTFAERLASIVWKHTGARVGVCWGVFVDACVWGVCMGVCVCVNVFVWDPVNIDIGF